MGSLVSGYLLAHAQKSFSASAPTPFVNARTNITLNGILKANTTQTRPALAPILIRQQTWDIMVDASADVKAGDTLTNVAFGTFVVTQVGNPNTFSASVTAFCFRATTATASTRRAGSVQLASVTVYGLEGAFLLPLQPGDRRDMPTAETTQLRQYFCAWPAGVKADWPVAPSDIFIMPATTSEAGGSYEVRDIVLYPGVFMSVQVGVEQGS